MSKEKLDAVALLGPLGSGKTTVLNNLIPHVPMDESYSVIVNDVGSVNIDARRITDHPANQSDRIIALTAGCIGCSDVTQFREAIKKVEDAGVNLLFIEPTGIAPGNEIMQVLREEGRNTSALALVNAKTIQRDLKWQVLPSQLAEADIVGITHADEKASDIEIISYALEQMPPLNADTALQIIRPDSMNANLLADLRGYGRQLRFGQDIMSLINKEHSCLCGHDHHHHDHGVIAQSLQLRSDAGINDLKKVLLKLAADANNPLLRAKGTLGGQYFDVVGDEWNQFASNGQNDGNVLNIIFGGNQLPSDMQLLRRMISQAPIEIKGDKKSIVKSISELPVEDRQAIIAERITMYPAPVSPIHGELITDCEADEGYEIAFWGKQDDISDESKQAAINAYIKFRLGGLHTLTDHVRDLKNVESKADYWLRRYGATLGYNGYYLEDYIEPTLLSEVRSQNPAQLLVNGFLQLNELTFDEGRAEEKPEFVASVLKEAVKRGDVTETEAKSLYRHGAQMSSADAEHLERWHQAFEWLSD